MDEDPYGIIADFRLVNVHAAEKCQGRACVIHNHVDVSLDEWPLHWREDRGIFERICVHGCAHPDPNQLEFWRLTGQAGQAIHGCCGCC